jgi:hypothetical protein
LLCLALGAGIRWDAPAHASTVRLRYEKTPDPTRADEATETEVKAAFLLKFPDFVNWATPTGDTLIVGVAGDAGLAEALRKLADEQNQATREGLGGAGPARRIVIRRVTSPTETRGCRILVLGDSPSPDLDAVLDAAHRAGVLTVGIWDQPREGAVIRLYREGKRVRFDVDQTLARDAGLRISSKLLNLARDQSCRDVPTGDALAQR